jgi:hypothetical protein
VRQSIIILLRRLNLPAHDEEHDEDNGDLFRLAADIGEGAQNVGEELRQRMRLDVALGVDQRSEVGIRWANERFERDAFGCARVAVLQEVEHNDIERTCRLRIPGQCEMGGQTRRVLSVAATAHVVGLRELGRWQVGVYNSSLAVVKQEVNAQSLVKGRIWRLNLRRAGGVEPWTVVVGVASHVACWTFTVVHPRSPRVGPGG